MPIDGGQVEVVAQGSSPAISPNGSRLAFASREESATNVLNVLELASGDRRSWGPRADEPDVYPENARTQGSKIFGLGELSWATDSRYLAFAREFEGVADLRILDASRSGTLMDSESMDTPGHPSYRGSTGELGVLVEDAYAVWRFSRVHSIRPEEGGRDPILLVDAPTWIKSFDFDSSGQYLLLTELLGDYDVEAGPGKVETRKGAGRIFRQSGGDLVAIAEGYLEAVW